MRLKWFKLAAAVVMLGTSAQAEWQFSVIDEGKYQARSASVADWREILVSALTINMAKASTMGGSWEILYVHPDGSIWDCWLETSFLSSSSCLVRR